jgi:hypothetical protein
MTSKMPWSIPVRRDDVPETGLHLELSADENTRNAVAALAGVDALPRLAASFDVTRRGSGLHVSGEVVASVGQTCVVTLEPITSEVRERIDLAFVPPAPKRESAAQDASQSIDPEAEDEPEPLVDGMADLGPVAIEFLMLGIDPYPRKPGAVFDAPKKEDDGCHPFAALAALKRGEGGQNG